MKTMRFCLLLVVIFATMLLAACGAPTAAPTATPVPPTPTPAPPTATPIPPTPETSDILSGYADNDGVRIHYEVEGEGPPLMIVNWWTGSIEDWRMFGYVDGLKEDYKLILVDMRGHGQSDKPHEAGSYDSEIVVSDIIAVLDELDIDKTHYFGHSLSGMLGWALAKYAPDRFHSFIISGDGPSGLDTSEEAAYLRSVGADAWARYFEEVTKEHGVWTPEIYDAYAGIDVEATALALTEISLLDVQADLTDIQVPFLLVAVPSDDDYATVVSAADRLPNAELYISSQDHGGTGVRSDLLLPHITEFLAEVSTETEAAAPEVISGYADNDGVSIYYEVIGEGEPLVMIHGGSGSTQDWYLFGYADALKDDYQLILVDLRGHGQSDKPHDAAAYSPETQVSDIIAVLDELGIDKTHYFGWSLGGALGWALATHAPERFHSMIINGDEPAGYDDSELTTVMLDMGADGWAKMVEDIARANDVWQPGIYDAYAGIDVEALALAFVELSWMDATDDLPDIKIPMLLIQGTDDSELTAMTEASELLPNAKLVTLDGLDHIQGFFLSDQVLPHITDFLAEVSAETEAPTASPAYAERGPYAVGVRNFEIEAEGEDERLLTTTVWYPALNPDGLPEKKYTYKMGFEGGEFPTFLVFGHALEDALPATDDGPYPVVAYSHGYSGFRQEAHYLAEQLASQGFVVIAADHRDNLGVWPEPKHAEDEFRRQSEVIRLLDFAEELGVTDEILANMVDAESAAVVGFSYGGQTSLVAGGARLDLEHLQQWCTDNTVGGKLPDPDCEYVLDEQQQLAALAGLDAVPDGLWPDWSDPRVDAVVSLAPWVGGLGQRGLENVELPTMLMIGSGDEDVGHVYEPIDPYTSIVSDHKAQVVFDGATHMLYWPTCDAAPQLVGWELEQLCNDPVWDNARAHDLINHFTTAFLLAELKGNAEAAAALMPEAVNFEGIEYQSEGYGS